VPYDGQCSAGRHDTHLEQAIVQVQADQAGLRVYGAQLPFLARPPDPVLYIPGRKGD
jgi:hypothetical protein